MNNNIVLRTFHLTKKFKNITAVDGLNLSVNRGDIFGFLGPNGAGKSTTIRMILGLVKPTAGEVKLFNNSLQKNRAYLLKKVGALVETPSFYNYLTARRNLEIFASLIGNVDYRHIKQTLKIVALSSRADDKVRTFSQGMKQRLGIAQALLGNPELIILDEPTAGLDPQGMKEIRHLISQLAQHGLTIFISSHLLHEVEQICNKMAIINKGKLVVQGSVEELLKSGNDLIILKVDRPTEAASLLKTNAWIKSIDVTPGEIKVTIERRHIPEMNRLLVTSGFKVFAIQPQSSLEDYFLSIVGAGNA